MAACCAHVIAEGAVARPLAGGGGRWLLAALVAAACSAAGGPTAPSTQATRGQPGGHRERHRRQLAGIRREPGADRRRHRGARGRPAHHRLERATRRRRLRAAARRRRRGDRRHGERQRLRAQPGDRQDDLARQTSARRYRSRRCTGAATSSRSASPAPPSTTRATAWSTPSPRSPGTTTCWSRSTRPPARLRSAANPRQPDGREPARLQPAAARRSRSTTGGSTPRSAGCPETAAPTRAASSARRSPATGR